MKIVNRTQLVKCVRKALNITQKEFEIYRTSLLRDSNVWKVWYLKTE